MAETTEGNEEQVIQLLREIANLRQNMYLHLVIGLNAEAIEASALSNALFGHLQSQALQSIALGICKIYEPPTRYELNSIPGAIASLPAELARPDGAKLVASFAASTGVSPCEDPRETLADAVTSFVNSNKGDFERFKTFRDKIAAHSEAGITIEKLPSHESFEQFYDFAYESYSVMRRAFFDVGPALIHRNVAVGLKNLLESNGVANAKVCDS